MINSKVYCFFLLLYIILFFFVIVINVSFLNLKWKKVQNIRGNFDDMCNFENIQYKENNVYFFDIVF